MLTASGRQAGRWLSRRFCSHDTGGSKHRGRKQIKDCADQRSGDSWLQRYLREPWGGDYIPYAFVNKHLCDSEKGSRYQTSLTTKDGCFLRKAESIKNEQSWDGLSAKTQRGLAKQPINAPSTWESWTQSYPARTGSLHTPMFPVGHRTFTMSFSFIHDGKDRPWLKIWNSTDLRAS